MSHICRVDTADHFNICINQSTKWTSSPMHKVVPTILYAQNKSCYVVLICHCFKILNPSLSWSPAFSTSFHLCFVLPLLASLDPSMPKHFYISFGFNSSLIFTFLVLGTLLFSAILLNTAISVHCTTNSCCLLSSHVSL